VKARKRPAVQQEAPPQDPNGPLTWEPICWEQDPAAVGQHAVAFDQVQQAVQGHGVQTSTLAARVGPTPAGGDRGPRDTGGPRPEAGQTALAADRAQQAVQKSGTQNVYFGERERAPEPVVSIAPPVGQRDEHLPLRGRQGC
jgi:hypothetical protein